MAKPDAEIWMVDLDGTGSMHPASKGDPDAISYTRTDTLPTWQPIETAPRDGTRILAICHYYMGVTARAATVDDPKVIWLIYYDHGLWQTNTFGRPLPTHWMPLPTPPKGNTHD